VTLRSKKKRREEKRREVDDEKGSEVLKNVTYKGTKHAWL